jgi:tetratricopeptide (TPR) repeat protein
VRIPAREQIIFIILFLTSCSQKTEHLRNARDFIQKWNYDRALTELISYRKDNDTEIQYLLGFIYAKKNELDEAAFYFEKALALSDTYKDSIVELYNTLARNALRINEQERALFLYGEIARLVPEYDQAANLFLIADLHFEKGNYPAAFEAYSKAYTIDSVSEKAQESRTHFITCLKECNMLEYALELATQKYEDLKTIANLYLLSEVRFALATKLYQEGLLDSAKAFFDEIVANPDPKSLIDDAYFYIGEIYYKRNNLSEALDAYKKVLRLNPYEKGEIVVETKKRIQEIKERL